MVLNNRDIPREPKPKEEKLIKNQECATCKNMYTCKGKPKNTQHCVNFSEREIKKWD